ncbi:allantoicase [Capsaspora owczarzaki ATCC 30864]|uniref:Allantoicase n=1 Tax=Capsaspora owczarzaki (strain ATCC 30864) TaxID=595528 RepID=A0A0D2U829_CAPO3|nr:allantoicase [Capsaspora owczarzaki ATCC 30864]KJE91261.1 allantoicase [Capsaspora owczarzaki ATCC 30864]|eukprot:XP_004349171.2 allantoicase [Capsaspora owczarzaki ATCC 30864]
MSSSTAQVAAPAWAQLPNLASDKVDTKILFTTDDFFAVAECMLSSKDPVFIPDAFTEFGKLMDGWETRRKRTLGHDWCIMQLGLSGIVKGIAVDTAFFTGNQVPRISVQAARLDTAPTLVRRSQGGTAATTEEIEAAERLGSVDWTEILPRRVLQPGYPETRQHYFDVSSNERWTHLRINLYPDGGIARLRVHGLVVRDWSQVSTTDVQDLVAVENGGRALYHSNSHYGRSSNLINPGRAADMGDGWETARRPDRPAIYTMGHDGHVVMPGSDFAVLKLGHVGVVDSLEIDTNHFKGNFPESCFVEACLMTDSSSGEDAGDALVIGDCERKNEFQRTGTLAANAPAMSVEWKTLLPRTKLRAHEQRVFTVADNTLVNPGAISHIRLNIYPDGGVSRVRALGRIRK